MPTLSKSARPWQENGCPSEECQTRSWVAPNPLSMAGWRALPAKTAVQFVSSTIVQQTLVNHATAGPCSPASVSVSQTAQNGKSALINFVSDTTPSRSRQVSTHALLHCTTEFLGPPKQSHTSWGRADEGLGIPLISLSGSNSST